MYDKRNDCGFEIVNFTFLDGDVPHSTSNLLEHLAILLTSMLAINC